MTNKIARKYTLKANRKVEKAFQKKVKGIIKEVNRDVKRRAKNGFENFRCKIKDPDIREKIRLHYISKGFRCWIEYHADNIYLYIAW